MKGEKIMAKFDDVTSRAKEVIDSVSRKTGDFVGVQKLRLSVSDANSKINKLYRELGEAVYASSTDSNDYTETIENLISAIDVKKEELTYLQSQIDTKQNKRTCPSCGKTNDAKAAFCSACGTQIAFSSSDDEENVDDADADAEVEVEVEVEVETETESEDKSSEE